MDVICDTIAREQGEGEDEDEGEQQHLRRPRWREVSSVCPGRDLLARTALGGSRVRVHRFVGSWATILDAHVVQPRVTALAWRADGLALVSGHADGSLVLYDPESPSAAWPVTASSSSATAHPAVVALQWRLCDCPDTLPADPGHYRRPQTAGFPFVWGAFDVLFSLDAAATLSVFASGMFLVGRIDCHIASLSAGLELAVSDDAMCAVVAAPACALQAEAATVAVTAVQCVAYDLSSLRSHRDKLWRIAQSVHRANGSASRVQSIAAAAKTKWRKAQELLARRRSMLNQMLQDHAVRREPEEDFLMFLTTGKPSPAMEQFLGSDKRLIIKPLECALESAAYSLEIELPAAITEFIAHTVTAQALLQGDARERLSAMAAKAHVLEARRTKVGALTHELLSLLSKQFQWLSRLPNDIAESLCGDVENNPAKWPDVCESAKIARSITATPAIAAKLSTLWEDLSDRCTELLDVSASELSKALNQEIRRTVASDQYTLTAAQPSRVLVEQGTCTICLGNSAVRPSFIACESPLTANIPEPTSFEELAALCATRQQTGMLPRCTWESCSLLLPEQVLQSAVAISFYKDYKIVALYPHEGCSDRLRLGVFSVAGEELVWCSDVPSNALSISVSGERGLCAVHCEADRLIIYNLGTSHQSTEIATTLASNS